MAESALIGFVAGFSLFSALMWAVAALGSANGCPFCSGFITPWGLLKRHRNPGEKP